MKTEFSCRFLSILALFAVILGFFVSCDVPTRTDPVSESVLSPTTYTVNFEANSGSPEPEQQTVTSGSKIITPAPMTRTGYGFGGWYKESDCINLWDFTSDTVTKNITLYAMWDTNYYTVSFDGDNGTPVPEQQNIAHGGMIVMPSAMTKMGYTFDGWYKEEDHINLWDFDSDVVHSNITIYAKWLKNFTVTFEANGGSPEPEQQSIAPDRKATIPSAMSKTGYTFDGWYKEADFSDRWNFATDTVIEDISLYAKWLVTHTVAFNTNGGTPHQTQQNILDGGKVNNPEDMGKEGYNFVGWYREEACINLWDFDNDEVTGNITLHAKWLIKTYTVTFNTNGGNSVEPIFNVEHGTIITVPLSPTNPGYAFDNWYINPTDITPFNFSSEITTNTILHAKWTYDGSLNIGDVGPGGGVIFYINSTGFTVEGFYYLGLTPVFESYTAHYLEAAPTDMPTRLRWANQSSSAFTSYLSAAEGQAIGTGRKNTNAIRFAGGTNAPAAYACVTYINNDKNDWFLPSYQELRQLLQRRAIIDNMIGDCYWSSSQYKVYADSAWSCGISFNEAAFKHSDFYVRAIRAF